MYNENNELKHYGTPHQGFTPHSGRYAYGSGENPYQRDGSFLRDYQEAHASGMTDKEFYAWLLENKNIVLELRWYDCFGSVDFSSFSDDKKFQEVHILNIDAADANQIVFAEVPLVYFLEEDIEEIAKEALAIQKNYFLKNNLENTPLIKEVSLKIQGLPYGETFTFRK